jgi:gamma-glutamylcyclotransferase (GGCT)/AIG2-like uncharacterized protein YtfP
VISSIVQGLGAIESLNLFVYGTLRRSSRNKFARLLQAHAAFLGAARISGRLHRLGKYPGAVPSNAPGEWVHGEVFHLHHPAQTLHALDHYEGPRFERVMATAHLASRIQMNVWVYFYRGTPAGPSIASGVWPRRR